MLSTSLKYVLIFGIPSVVDALHMVQDLYSRSAIPLSKYFLHLLQFTIQVAAQSQLALATRT